jgi:hypothetical protein
MAQLLTIMLGALLRMLLLAAFGALIQRGVWTTGQVDQLALGLAGFISVACWALWNHYKNRLKFLTALETPAGATECEVVAKVNAGLGASLKDGR